jgi:hypothetical protein
VEVEIGSVVVGIVSAILGIVVVIAAFVGYLDKRINARVLKGFEIHSKETEHHRPSECPLRTKCDQLATDVATRRATIDSELEHLERRTSLLEERVASFEGTGTRRRIGK